MRLQEFCDERNGSFRVSADEDPAGGVIYRIVIDGCTFKYVIPKEEFVNRGVEAVDNSIVENLKEVLERHFK